MQCDRFVMNKKDMAQRNRLQDQVKEIKLTKKGVRKITPLI